MLLFYKVLWRFSAVACLLCAMAVGAAARQPPMPGHDINAGASKGTTETLTKKGTGTLTKKGIGFVVPVSQRETLGGLTLDFSFPKQVAAAAFERGGIAWVVFAGTGSVDLDALNSGVISKFSKVAQVAVPGALVLRFPNYKEAPSLIAEGFHWVVRFGSVIGVPTRPPLTIKPEADKSGRMRLVIPVDGTPPLFTIVDPDAGDKVVVVPLLQAGAAVPIGVDLPELRILPTSQGFAMLPKADSVDVSVQPGEILVTNGHRGLAVSDALTKFQTQQKGAASGIDQRYDVARWATAPMGYTETSVDETRRLMTLAIAQAEPTARAELMFRLGRYLVSKGLGAEATGIAQLILERNPGAVNDPSFRLMRGIAAAEQRHCSVALADLQIPALEFAADAALWRGMCYEQTGRIHDAVRAFGNARSAYGNYALWIRQRILAAVARAALKDGNLSDAKVRIDNFAHLADNNATRAEVELLRGQLAQRSSKADAAIAHYKAALNFHDVGTRVEAELGYINLLLEKHQMSLKEAIDRLERLSFAWRGDNLELEVLTRLANLQFADDRWRDGLITVRNALKLFPNNPSRDILIAEEHKVFNRLFLHGAADTMPPVQAVALYFDFRDLTPFGQDGDEMIRKLADRLVSVDLIPQAEALLDHQVRTRLTGIPQAQVAARLALLHLIDRDANGAISILDTTKQPVMPENLTLLRRRIRARALADLGKSTEALALLTSDTSQEGIHLAAEIAWEARLWSVAAKDLSVLVQRFHPPATGIVPPDMEGLILKLAIARALAGDTAGLAALKVRFGSLMQRTPSKNAFEMLVGRHDQMSLATKNLAQTLANAGGFRWSFIDEMRAKMMKGSLSTID